MADMIVSSLHTPEAEQASAGTSTEQEQGTVSAVIEAPPAVSAADAGDPAASIELDPEAPVAPTTPIAPVVPTGPGSQPVPVEDELDELIIEDFTIDGICGVY